MISTQSTGDRRLTPSQREALGKFVSNPFPLAHTSVPVRQRSTELAGVAVASGTDRLTRAV